MRKGVDQIDALVIGEALVDVVRSDEGDRDHPGGSPANVALGLGRLGANVALLTDLGDDGRGARMSAHLEASGVGILEESFSGRPTSTAVAVLRTDGSASYEFDVRWDPARMPPVLRPRIVHTGSIAAFLEPGAQLVAEYLRTTAAPEVTFDPNIRPAIIGRHSDVVSRFENLAARATLVKLSDEDAEWLYPDLRSPQVLDRVRRLGPNVVALTMGRSGSLISVADSVVTIAPAFVEAADTIGAGDSYMAFLISSLLEQPSPSWTAETAAEIGWRASCAAALTVGRRGADLPNAIEVDAFVASHERSLGGSRL